MTKRECQTCKYFDRSIFDPSEDRTSWCLRYPPVYIGPRIDTLTEDGPFDEPNDTCYWERPTVGICGYCGEWRECDERMTPLMTENDNIREVVVRMYRLLLGKCEAPHEQFHGKPCESCAEYGSDDCPIVISRELREFGIEVE